MSRLHSILLAVLTALAVTLGVLFALERSRANDAVRRHEASAAQVATLTNVLASVNSQIKELRFALAIANQRLAEAGQNPVAVPTAAPDSTPPTSPTIQPNQKVCTKLPLLNQCL